MDIHVEVECVGVSICSGMHYKLDISPSISTNNSIGFHQAFRYKIVGVAFKMAD